MPASDRALLDQWRSRREAEAFNEIVSRHAPMVFSTCKRILRNEADAEDVAQECFLELARGEVRVQSSLAGWLHSLARSRSVDWKRRETRRRAREVRHAVESVRPEDRTWAAIGPLVDEAIEALRPELRDVVVAHYLERETHEAISMKLDLTRAQVAYRLEQGVEAIRRWLRRQGVKTGAVVLGSLLSTRMVEAAPPGLFATLGKVALAGTAGAAAGARVAVSTDLRPGWGWWRTVAPPVALASTIVFILGMALLIAVWRPWPPDPAPPSAGPQPVLVRGGAAMPDGGAPEAAVVDAPREEAAPAPASPPRRGYSLTGRLVHQVEAPGAAATVTPAEGVSLLLQPHPRRGKRELAPPPVARTTGPDGRFAFEGLPWGAYFQLVIDPPQGALLLLSFEMTDREEGRTVDLGDLVVEPAVDFIVEVSGPYGEPVEGAEVLVNRKTDPRLQGRSVFVSRNKGVEMGAGSYAVQRAPRGVQLVQALAGGYSRFLREVTVSSSGETVHVRLLRGLRVAGLVVTAEGNPLEDAALEIRGPNLGLPHPRTRSDAQGRFAFDFLSDGEHTLRAWAVGFAETVRTELRPDAEDLLVQLEREAVFAGTVAAEPDGAPLPGARVILDGPSGSREAQTGSGGEFLVRGIPAGGYQVIVDQQEFGLWAVGPLELQAGETVEGAELRVGRGATVNGAVVDARSEQGLSGALVSARLLDSTGKRSSQRRTATTLPDGTFALSALGQGDYEVEAAAEGFPAAEPQSLRIGDGAPEELLFLLEKGGSISGRVLDPHGRPIRGASVRFSFPYSLKEDWDQVKSLLNRLATQTDADGSFSAVGLPARDGYLVVASHHEHAPGSRSGFQLAEGQRIEGLELVLSPGVALQGRVTDEEGRGLSGAAVIARFCGGPGVGSVHRDGGAVSDDDGRFFLSCLRPGTYTLLAQAPGRVQAGSPEVLAAEGAVTGITLFLKPRSPPPVLSAVASGETAPRRVRVTGRITLMGLLPFSEGTVLVCPAGGLAIRGAIDLFGNYGVELPGPGRFHFMISRRDGTGGCKWLTVPAGVRECSGDIELPHDDFVPLVLPE